MKTRHRYLIARTSIIGCLLATALSTAIAVADSAAGARTVALHSSGGTGGAYVAMSERSR